MIISLKQKKIKFKPRIKLSHNLDNSVGNQFRFFNQPSEIFMLTHSIDPRLQSENCRFKTSRKLTNNTNFLRFDSRPLNFKSAIFLCFRVIKLSFFFSYRKIPKISSGAYFFSKVLFEGLIFARACLRRVICVSEPYGWKEIYRFCFVLLCI